MTRWSYNALYNEVNLGHELMFEENFVLYRNTATRTIYIERSKATDINKLRPFWSPD